MEYGDNPKSMAKLRGQLEQKRFLSTLESAFRDGKTYLVAVAIYFGSRLVVLLAIKFAGIYLPLWKGQFWRYGSSWYDHLLEWDSQWYLHIAAQGYYYDGNGSRLQPVAFFPLYPLLAGFVAWVAGISPGAALLIVANVAAVLAVLLLCRLLRQSRGDEVAVLSVALLSFYPGSLFLSAGYSEALALALILGFFILLGDGRYISASLCAGLAAATRPVGIVLAAVLLWELWLKFRADRRQFVGYAIPCTVIASSGLWIYAAYLAVAFGSPLAFIHAQGAFNANTPLGDRLVSALTLQPFWQLSFAAATPADLDQWFFILFLGLTVLAWRRLSASLALFMLGVLLLPYLTLSGGPHKLLSMTRFALLAFPAFIVLAELSRRVWWLGVIIVGLFAAILGLHSALFAQGYWVG